MNLVASLSDIAMLMKMEKTDSNFETNVANANKENVVRITISPESLFWKKEISREVGNMDAKVLVKNYSNFKESGCPGRVMYYSEDGSWVDYSPEVVELVRRCFELKNPLVEVNRGGFRCLLDFCRMLEIEFDTGKVRSIAWIDVNRKCFFPNSFVSHVKPSPNPKIDLEVKVCGNGGGFEGIKVNGNGTTRPVESWNYRVKQSPKIDLEVKDCGNGGEFEGIKANGNGAQVESWNYHVKHSPEIDLELELKDGENRGEFDEIEGNATNAMWTNTKLWNEAEIEQQTYVKFKNFLRSTIRIVEHEAIITRIHKCEHKAKIEVFMNQLQAIKRNNGDPNVVFAWYGTSAQGVESILAHGFDTSNQFQCPKGYGVGGGGVLFSPVKFPHHSAVMSEVDSKGEKHMILCRIILGRCRKATDAGSLQRLAYSKDFDSAVVESKKARYYVVWPDKINTHILPEAVVSYNPGSTINGQLRGNLDRKMVSIGGLFSALKKSLPQPKANELHVLYGSYKGGRIGRDVFARRLRVIAGDERLRSVIREIHG